MTIEEKREIWKVVLESAGHSALAPYLLVNELVAAHGVLYGDDPHRNPVFPMTAEEVEAMTDSPNEISRELLLQIERREGQSRYKP